MSFEPFERVDLGRTGLRVTRLAFGAAEIGGLYRPVEEAAAAAVVREAWRLGVRYFDVAPLYGHGLAEERLGRVLQAMPRDEFVLSTKVGRLLEPDDADAATRATYAYQGTPRRRPVFDFSYDGVMRSVEASLGRLGLERIDVLYLHDPDEHWAAAIDHAYPALARLRADGVVRAIGAGMNQAGMLVRFAHEADMDVFLLAGRYTLLDQAALPELLPLCLERRIAVVVGGVMNSGLLADPRPGSHFDYEPAQAALIERAVRLRTVCERHGVALRAAAVQFALAHPAVTTLLTGVRSVAHLDEYPELMRASVPAALWTELRDEGLLPPDAPTPGSNSS